MTTGDEDEVEELLRAFSARDLDAIRRLADAGFDLDARGGGELTVLMRAVLRDDAVAIEWILAAGADPDARGGDDRTALDLARELDRPALVELLVMAGARDRVRDRAPIDRPTAARPAEPRRREPPLPPVEIASRGVAESDVFDDELDDDFDDDYRDGCEEDWSL